MNGFLRTRLAAVTVAGLLWAGCAGQAPRPVDFSEARKSFSAADYDTVRAAWTRHGKAVRDIGTVIETWAVLKSWEFRQAWVERYAQVYHLSGEERTRLLSAQLEEARTGYDFHAVVQTTNHTWNDLERKTSPWRVTLVDARGVEIGPASIEEQKLPELYEEQFFPIRTEFSRTYLIRFRPDPTANFGGHGSGALMLRFASPLAETSVVWQAKK